MKNFLAFISGKRVSAARAFPATYPDRKDLVGWMHDCVAAASHDKAMDAALLFDPTSGDYLPLRIHVGSQFDDAALLAYRMVKRDYPDLVEAATQAPVSYSVSGIADPQDLDAHAHRICV